MKTTALRGSAQSPELGIEWLSSCVSRVSRNPRPTTATFCTGAACEPEMFTSQRFTVTAIEPSLGGAVPLLALCHRKSVCVLVLKKNSPGACGRWGRGGCP